MTNFPAQTEVEAWRTDGMLLELYRYTTGTIEPLPPHAHSEYQFSLSLNSPGEYFYRGAKHKIPIGEISIIHSGEPHAPSDARFLENPSSYMMLYISPAEMLDAGREIFSRQFSELPFFSSLNINNKFLLERYAKLFAAERENLLPLAKSGLKIDFINTLLENFAQNAPPLSSHLSSPTAVARAAEFLHANAFSNISLDEVAGAAALSKFHLSRIFKKQIGISPYQYQMQIRLDRAKELLLKNFPIADIAHQTGFYDQSHFSKMFKRYVGVTPKKYLV